MRLRLDGAGNVAGSLNLALGGEQCNLSLTEHTAFSPTASEQCYLTWSGGGPDPDNDATCATVNGVSKNMGFVIETGGQQF